MILLGTSGQTQYLGYRRSGDTNWYFEKRAMFYLKPLTLEGAEEQYTYFKYTNGISWVYNDNTKKYDIKKDTADFVAVVDVKSITALVDLIEQNMWK